LQDDTASIKLLHNILRTEDRDNDGGKQKVDDDYDSSEPETPSTSAPMASARSDRRRSLPLCPSIASLRSEYSITSPPEISTFEQKRRRAAKLTNFFGVNHRDIMEDILDSIENGVAEERGRGTLNQAQADVRLPPFFVPHGGIFADLGSHPGLASESVEPQNQDLILLIYPFVYITFRPSAVLLVSFPVSQQPTSVRFPVIS